ncbi:MAG: biotin transporter BioY [Schaedlerella sp.]|nr:biotin transporter BioY [Schaedlerella sp.]
MKKYKKESKYSVQDLCNIAILTAVTAVMAQISIPMPVGVPLTMQTFAVAFAAIVLGARNGMISMVIYLLLGAVGVPVFANFGGGLHHLLGPTGGFLLSFPIMAWLIGWGAEHKKQKVLFVMMLIFGTSVNFIVGLVFFSFVMESTLAAAFVACVLPYLPWAVVKAVGAAVLGLKMRKRLSFIL